MAGMEGRSDRAKKRNALRGDQDFQFPEEMQQPAPKKIRVRDDNLHVARPAEILEVLTPEQRQIREELFTRVFNNDLVWENISNKLDVMDMKQMSQTNYSFFDKIRGLKSFQNQTIFPISLYKCIPELHPNHEFEFVWKNVELDINLFSPPTRGKLKKIIPTMSRRLRNTESLYICAKRENYDESRYSILKLKQESMKAILSSVPNLECLTMLSTMLIMNWTKIWCDTNVRACFERLKDLHLIIGERAEADYAYVYSFRPNKLCKNLSRSLKQLASIPMKLRRFTWKSWFGEELNLSPVVDIILASQETLTSLTIDQPILETDGFDKLQCPVLTHLKVSIGRYREKSKPAYLKFLNFLSNLNSLMDLDISIGTLEPQLLNILQTKTQEWALHRLRIHLIRLHPTIPVDNYILNGIDLNTVRLFEIWNLRSKISHRQLLPELPSDLKSMNLRGLKTDIADTTTSLSAFMRSQLQRFSCLTELSLLNKINEEVTPVDDDLLHCIFQNLTKLQILRLSNCPRITNNGFAGSRRSSSGNNNNNIGIRNLKRLRHLVIKNCPNITDRSGLVAGIRFDELTFLLIVQRDHDVSLATWKLIVKQNPRLNTIVLQNDDCWRIASELKALNRSIHHVFNCPKSPTFLRGRYPYASFTPSTLYYEDQYTKCRAYEGDLDQEYNEESWDWR